jgi:3-deoxy-7-phosphoheptulonate synthase
MIIAMAETATKEQIESVIELLASRGINVHRTTGATQTVLGLIGNTSQLDEREMELLPGVLNVHRVSSPYKLAARSFRPDGTVVKLKHGVEIGGKGVVVMAGPCSIENREQIFDSAAAVAKAGARILRGGAYKPRSSPYAFQGLGVEGLKMMRDAADQYNLLAISEVMEISQIETMLPYVDILQVGARNMQNFNLLRELGQIRKPVLLKRGIAATYEELLLASEYILSGGNYDLILCERGIRTFESYTRNTMDVCAIPILHKLSHLPVTADPSHGTGLRDKVAPMACASVAAGADALTIEVHPCPSKALSDGAQSLHFDEFEKLMSQVRLIATAVGRSIA